MFGSQAWHVWAVVLSILLLNGIDSFLLRGKRPTLNMALALTGFYIALAFVFDGVIYITRGKHDAFTWVTGYALEWSLSIDNLLVLYMLLVRYLVPERFRNKVLTVGVFSAILARTFLAGEAATLIQEWEGLLYGLAGILALSIYKMHKDDDDSNIGDSKTVRILRKFLPISEKYDQQGRFFLRHPRWMLTPLALVCITIAGSNILFGIDSGAAILSVTRDPFLVVTSSVLALPGLRSMYFVLEDFIHKLPYLKKGVLVILYLVVFELIFPLFSQGMFGQKLEIPNWASLAFVFIVMGIAVGTSINKIRKEGPSPSELEGVIEEVIYPSTRITRVLPQGPIVDGWFNQGNNKLKFVLGLPTEKQPRRKIVLVVDYNESTFPFRKRKKIRKGGFLGIGGTTITEPSSVEQTIYDLADTLSAHSLNNSVYLALCSLGDEGKAVLPLPLGEFRPLTNHELHNLVLPKVQYGSGRKYMPVIQHYLMELELEEDVELTFVVITDGEPPDTEDYAALFNYADNVSEGFEKPAKVIFVIPRAVTDKEDAEFINLEQLDNLRMSVDVFDLRLMREIDPEQLLDEPLFSAIGIVAASGRVLSADGKSVLLDLSQGVPKEFLLEVPEGHHAVIVQIAGFPDCEVVFGE